MQPSNTPNTKQEVVKFEGYEIVTFSNDQGHFIAIKPLAEMFQLDWSAQFRRIKRDPILGPTIAIMATVGADDKQREMVCLPLEYFPGWLFKIDVSRIKNEYLKPVIIEFQKKAYAVLYEHFYGAPKEELQQVKWLNERYCEQITELYAREIFKDDMEYLEARWVYRVRFWLSFKDIGMYGGYSAGKASKLHKKFVHFLDATHLYRRHSLRYADAGDFPSALKEKYPYLFKGDATAFTTLMQMRHPRLFFDGFFKLPQAQIAMAYFYGRDEK